MTYIYVLYCCLHVNMTLFCNTDSRFLYSFLYVFLLLSTYSLLPVLFSSTCFFFGFQVLIVPFYFSSTCSYFPAPSFSSSFPLLVSSSPVFVVSLFFFLHLYFPLPMRGVFSTCFHFPGTYFFSFPCSCSDSFWDCSPISSTCSIATCFPRLHAS
jgi:hypothetical protein